MPNNEEENLFQKGVELVERINKVKPASSFRLRDLPYNKYVEMAKTEANAKNTMMQHKTLIKFWANNLVKGLDVPKDEKASLKRYLLDSHGNAPPSATPREACFRKRNSRNLSRGLGRIGPLN